MWWILGALAMGVIGWTLFVANRRTFDWQPPAQAPVVVRQGCRRETVHFGAIEGWLYLPARARPPVILMAPGLTGIKDGILEQFAWVFAEAGFAVLTIDFRTFGASAGMPRHWLDPQRQVEDYRTAIAALRREPRIDGDRIVLWGSSFSGAAAIAAAADGGITAVIAQVPYLGGVPIHAPSLMQMAGYIGLTIAESAGDALMSLVGITPKPVYITVFGRPGERAFAMSAGNPARRGRGQTLHPFWEAAEKAQRGGWKNAMLVRGLRNLDTVRAGDILPALSCPVLLIGAMQDDMIAFGDLRAAAERLPAGSHFLPLDCGHYDPYVAPLFVENIRAQVEFLRTVLH